MRGYPINHQKQCISHPSGVKCKAPGGRQSSAQKAIEQEIRRRNGIYVLARCVEDVQRAIEDADCRE